MDFSHELIMAIMNEGYSDTVMDAARSAGAGGGTVLHAKGTGRARAEKFFGVSLADEKDRTYRKGVSLSAFRTALQSGMTRRRNAQKPLP